MAKARVFISHSTSSAPATDEERRADEVLTNLTRQLNEAGYVVQVDREVLQGGMAWRSVINGWLGSCEAALLLLSSRALASDFVAYEASVLAHRRVSDATFRLIPVHLVDAEQIGATTKLAPAQLSEVQGIDARTSDPGAQVLALLTGLARRSASSRPAMQLRDLLLSSFPSDLQQAAQLLGVDLDVWHADLDLPALVASKMIAAGLEDCIPALQHVSARWDARDLEEAIQIVACGWVDDRAAERIPHVVDAGGALESNAQDPTTARLYLLRASPFRPRKSWLMVTIDGVVGELSADAHRAEVLRKVRTALEGPLKTQDPALLSKRLDIRRRDKQFVFVALSRRGISAALFAELRKMFPAVTFFVLEGSSNAAELRVHEADEYILPELTEGEEQRYLTIYREKCEELLETQAGGGR